MQTDQVPMIDLSAFAAAKTTTTTTTTTSNNKKMETPTKEQLKVAAELRNACEKVGFFYIKGHGCSTKVVQDMNRSMKEFFDLPLPDKLELEANKNPLWRGYNSLEKGAHSCTPDDQENQGKRDHKESFTIGAEPDMGKSPMHGPNQWPTSKTEVKDFEQVARQYWNTLRDPVATRLMQALALSLDLPMDYFVSKCQRSPHPQMVLLRYPPAPASKASCNKQKAATGCGAHTDCGFLTILTQDQPGLEVKHANGSWVSAPPIKDAFVVNLGDMMAHWTNDRYQSTQHRVSNPSSTITRHSIPFFWTVDYDTVIEPIPSCRDYRGGKVYPPTTSGEYILGKLGLMYLAGGDNKKDDEEEEDDNKSTTTTTTELATKGCKRSADESFDIVSPDAKRIKRTSIKV